MRGLVAVDVEFSNASSDLHSGVHGGIALNPNRVLDAFEMWDQSGKIPIPHFYDAIVPLSKEDSPLSICLLIRSTTLRHLEYALFLMKKGIR